MLKKLLILPPILIGIAVLVYMAGGRQFVVVAVGSSPPQLVALALSASK